MAEKFIWTSDYKITGKPIEAEVRKIFKELQKKGIKKMDVFFEDATKTMRVNIPASPDVNPFLNPDWPPAIFPPLGAQKAKVFALQPALSFPKKASK